MDKRTVLTILSENTSGHAVGLLAEHGFSALIERNGLRILFDTGQGQVLLNNAARLGIDLGHLDSIVLSHGHWDHAGGLREVLALNREGLPIYAHPGVFAERYFIEKKEGETEGILRYAGIPFPRVALEAAGAHFEISREPKELADGVWLTGEIPRKSSFEKTAKQLRIREGGQLVADAVIDEQSLVIRSMQGLIVVLGCAHPGMINTIEHAIRLTGIPEIEAVVGGTHLMFQDDDQLEASIAALKGFDPKLVGTSHCTGGRANARIRSEFPDRFLECNIGTILKFG